MSQSVTFLNRFKYINLQVIKDIAILEKCTTLLVPLDEKRPKTNEYTV